MTLANPSVAPTQERAFGFTWVDAGPFLVVQR